MGPDPHACVQHYLNCYPGIRGCNVFIRRLICKLRIICYMM